uniref:Small ribosomal subunit protein bS18c n=1 Tax=Trachelomonas grandis TaxID=215769 RepID=A0A385UK32_9EUGL|nr:ribosomal protein S18 [Trachelomonas grandis]
MYFKNMIEYKNIYMLRKFVTVQGKIIPKRVTNLTSKRQRQITKAIKRSRILGLIIFINKGNI